VAVTVRLLVLVLACCGKDGTTPCDVTTSPEGVRWQHTLAPCPQAGGPSVHRGSLAVGVTLRTFRDIGGDGTVTSGPHVRCLGREGTSNAEVAMSRCGSCNRPLRDARSIELGFGPGCWARLDYTEREAVRARLRLAAEAAERRRPAPEATAPRVAAVTAPPEPAPPQRSDSVLATLAAWAVGLTLVLALILFWRWLLVGIGILGATAMAGLLIERLQERGVAIPGLPKLVRSVSREADEIAATMGPRPSTAVGSRSMPTTPTSAM
jgi:hypothetical protein